MTSTRGTAAGDGGPKPYQVRVALTKLLGTLEPGQALPPERALAQQFGVSRSTVRQAITDMVAAGLVQRVHGSGTYPVDAKVQLPLRLASYTRDVSDQGLQPTSRIVSMTRIPADPAIAAALDVPEGQRVWRLERLRLTNGSPLAVECTHLSCERFPDLKRLMKDNTSLYRTLEDVHGLTVTRAVQTIETAMATPEQYKLLEADSAAPVLVLTRTTYDQKGQPMEYVLSTYRGDRVRLTAVLLPQP
jgi:GntR family transcriptional regulator, nutrient-sensing system regulator